MDIRKIIREELEKAFNSPNSTVNTSEFKNWFGDSEMVDREGNPIIFYHGSKSEFDKFDKSNIGTQTDPGWLEEGFYFYDNPHKCSTIWKSEKLLFKDRKSLFCYR